MKLSKLKIINFRGLKGKNNIIEFNDSNIIFLIGQNDVGKSTFLNAYEFFVNPSQKAAKTDFYDYDPNNRIEIIGEFIKEDIDNDNEDFQREPQWISKWVDPKGDIIRIKKVWCKIDQKFKKYTYNPDESVMDFIPNGFGGFDTLFSKYAPKPILINAVETSESFEKKVNGIIESEYLKKIETKFGIQYREAVKKISELQMLITNSDEIVNYNERISSRFNKVFPGLKLKISQKDEDKIDVNKAFRTNHSVDVIREGVERKETFSQHGHGVIRQALFNFVAFMKNQGNGDKKEFVILFEEPELFMHPKATKSLRDELYEVAENSPFQILCATHSPMMIDISKPHSSLVRIVKKADESTQTYQVGHSIFHSEENKDFVQMINRFNPHVCETFYANEVLLVEGDTEAVVFRYLLDNYYKQNNLYVLNTGSKNNMVFYQKILTHFEIKHNVLHDSDTRFNKNGNSNSAWTINSTIWKQVEESNSKGYELARRYIHCKNFEDAHPDYCLDTKKGKPLSAYEYVKTLTNESNVSCVNILNDILGDRTMLHDQEYVESLEPLEAEVIL
jgi:predicted ATP-dependent endonuclease of OLD family